jgi:N-acetylmuramoyl-L-alanine amidase
MSPKAESPPPAPAKKAVVMPPAPAARKQPASTRFPDPEWVNVVDAARRLGLKLTWKVQGREAVLSDRDTRLEVAGDRIEVELNGQRVFLGQALLPRGGELFVTKIDLERCLVPLVRPELIGKAKSRPQVIVIDPGHGGPDKGMINERLNLFEKTFTLDTSQRLKKILETRGWKVVLTRTDDRQLLPGKADDLRRRAEIADEVDADVFVSVHFNAVAEQVEKVRGLEVFRFTPQHQPPISRAVRRLDDAQLSPGNGNDPWNSLLAHLIQNAMLTRMKLEDRGFKHERFAVLRLVSCPAVLIEGGFMSNQAEAKMIATPAYRQRLAEAIADGLTDYRATLDRLRAEGKKASR